MLNSWLASLKWRYFFRRIELMAHIDFLPLGSSEGKGEQISHFAGSQGASLPGAARKDKVDGSFH